VLQLVAAGRTDGEIGASLFITRKTASVHVSNIKARLGASSRIDIVNVATRLGLIDPAAIRSTSDDADLSPERRTW
jgi:DNA-binding CsgD family transcriptional regulator